MYGENGTLLRTHLVALLRQYRVNQRILRDLSRIPSPLAIETRQAEACTQVRRYRQTILAWCHEAVTRADPNPRSVSRNLDPPTHLRLSLSHVLAKNPGPLPTMPELTTPQQVRTLESWRQAAKATTQAERDFDRGLGDGLLDHREWLTLVGDIADVTKALLILDKRYQHLPDWQVLRGTRHLEHYADECATLSQTRYRSPDYNIDWRGWYPPEPEISPDADPMTHVIAAEHRLLNSLRTVPSMANLRHLLTSQREVSHLAADRAREVSPEQAARFHAREQTYARLLRAARGAGGLAGTGAAATGHSAQAVRLLATIHLGEPITIDAFRNLDKLFRHVDKRLSAAIEHGFNTRLYLVRRTLPRIDSTDGRTTHGARYFYDPLPREGQSPLIAIARRHLHTEPPRMAAPGSSAFSRTDLRAAISNRSGGASGLSV